MSTRGRTVRLGTRGSDLALRQAAAIKERLEKRRYDVDLVEVETEGDQLRDEYIHQLGTTGAFVRALDDEVLDGDLDAAVHSLKDVPTEVPDELVIAGVPERASARDVLVSPDGFVLDELREGAVVGTSSLRRQAQLLAERPDLAVRPLRGNVDTRIEKLLARPLQREHERRIDAETDEETGADADADADASDRGGDDSDDTDEDHPEYDQPVEEWFDDLAEIERRAMERDPDVAYDAIVLAEAGLERIGLLHHLDHHRLRPQEFVPAPGQGVLAVTALDDELAVDLNEVLDHPPTRIETTVERTILSELGGGCVAPVGIYAVLTGSVVQTTVRVLARDGTEQVQASRDLPVTRHREAAQSFAADLADRGADDLIARARRADDEVEPAKRDPSGSDETADAGGDHS